MHEERGERDGENIADDEAADRLDHGGPEIAQEYVGFRDQRLEHDERSGGDEGRHLEEIDERRPDRDSDKDAEARQDLAPYRLAPLGAAIFGLGGIDPRLEPGKIGRSAHASPARRPRSLAAMRLKGSVSRIASARSRGKSISTAARTRPGLAARTSTVSPR